MIMIKLKYIVVCKFCGTILLKTEDSIIGVLKITIKCPNCKKILEMPNDVIIKGEKLST